MNGILNINKPSGETSFSVVSLVKKLSKQRHIGHAGILDSPATGVLPVCIGQATRVIEYLLEVSKVYVAQIELGVVTDTYDASGRVIQRNNYSNVSREQLELALTSFRGSIQQIPPMYSAIRYQGKRLYQLAQEGIEVQRRARTIYIYRLELLDWQPPLFTLEVECSKGTYIRSLAYDLGQRLGCGAYLKSLVRSRYGLFELEDAISLSTLKDAFRHGYWQHFIYPVDFVLSQYLAMLVGQDAEQNIRSGIPISLIGDAGEVKRPDQNSPILPSFNQPCRAYNSNGCFVAMLHFNSEKKQWQPKKVFSL